jgi:hypothetical protein
MIRRFLPGFLALFVGAWAAFGLSPDEAAKLPPAAGHHVDFVKEIKPLFEAACIKCHAKGKEKGDLSMETRAALLKGGESGVDVILGKGGESPIVAAVSGLDLDLVMPKKGSKWTAEQVGLLRAWIDQGAVWPENITFAKPAPINLQPREVQTPGAPEENPIDRLLAGYFAAKQFAVPAPVEDRLFARRAYLDTVGLLPTPEQLEAFGSDQSPDRRAKLVRQLLQDDRGYAGHWISFWSDLLRNDYRGIGFIDGGRKQITEWLYDSLLTNKPYDRFVTELLAPDDKSLGFTAGIIWRGAVPAVMLPPMQAAQSVSQVFLGINLKCASCHDSFVNDWSLADAYGMAAVFSDKSLELVHCDKPTGKQAVMRFLYPQLGALDPAAPKAERLKQFAALMTGPRNGRLTRTLVNRLWARLLGRGLVEPLDDMEQPAWSSDLLDWLASDFAAHGYDIRHTLEVIMTSRAYQLPTCESPKEKEVYVFRGPLMRRLSAEQFCDAVSALTGSWARLPSTLELDFTGGGRVGSFTMPRWIWTDEPFSLGPQRVAWRYVKTAADKAQAKAAEAQRLVDAGDPKAPEAMKAAKQAANDAAGMVKWADGTDELERHKVVFRKTFNLGEKPRLAYATVAASQPFEVTVNGTAVKPKLTDGFRNGRLRLYDFNPLLKVGENLIAVSVDSLTEKQMNDTERKQFPSSINHLNKVSGLAVYLRCQNASGFTEIVSDETWRNRRSPEGIGTAVKVIDAAWAKAAPLPDGVAPVDEGPGLEPIRRQDFANLPVELGPALRAAASTAAFAGEIRASLLAADPLQAALDRPNRDIVTPARPTSATTIQALELTNGSTLNDEIEGGAKQLAAANSCVGCCVDRLYEYALARPPTKTEWAAVKEMMGETVQADKLSDLIWSLVMLPEFQFIN